MWDHLAATSHAEDALQQFAEALRLRPDDVDAHLAMAKTLLGLQRFDQAPAAISIGRARC